MKILPILNLQTHALIPILVRDAELTQKIIAALFTKGIYVIGISFPAVPKAKLGTEANFLQHTPRQIWIL